MLSGSTTSLSRPPSMKGPLLPMSGTDINKAVAEATLDSPEKKDKKPSLVELKNGKVIFKQKSISFEKNSETLQEIVRFREMLEERINKQEPPLTVIPDEHSPLIAKLAHESDKALIALSKHIRQELLPTQDEEEEHNSSSLPTAAALPLGVVEAAIKAVLTRNNYGLDALNGGKAPAAVCVWRWEVKEKHKEWLPKNAKEKAEARQAERVQAKRDLKALFDTLPQAERDVIIDPKGAAKLPAKELNKPDGADVLQPVDLTGDDPKLAQNTINKQGKVEEENEATDTTPGRAGRKKGQDPEKAAKEKERLEKKAAKAEKEKKEKDAQNKSRSLMANFFAKPKASVKPAFKLASSAIAGPSKVQTDFERTFKPFVLKKDTALAPVNWFLDSKKRKRKPSSGANVITIDIDEEETKVEDEDVHMKGCSPPEENLEIMSAHDHLQSVLRSLPRPADPHRLRRPGQRNPSHMKTYHPVAIRDVVSQLSEAEIAGDDSTVRHLLSRLQDRTLFPAKIFIFAEDGRPGYFGTWTRSSRVIGPRNPFTKDMLVFDYSYDSGEEWEEEPAGEADDVVEDGEDEDVDEDADSDLDSWLVEDEDDPDIPLDDRDLSPPMLDFPIPPAKRKAEDSEKKIGKKRKVVIPLVPFAKGPRWESSIGRCEDDTFKPYRIQLFNDTPLPIDPFTFVSTCVEDKRASERVVATSAVPAQKDGVFVVPPLPEHLSGVNTASSSTNSAPTNISAITSTFSATTVPKKPAPTPKNPFPDTHLPFLLKRVTEMQAPSLVLLVEVIYQDLKEHKIKKNAIEAKVKEVGERCKEKKFWVVKDAAQQAIHD